MTVEDLIKCNQSFHYKHGVTEKELEIAEKHISVINHRQKARLLPQAGDLVAGTFWDSEPYNRGLIVKIENEVAEVCYKPYIPFISTGSGYVMLSVSGGPFTHAHISCFDLMNESEERLFCDWGSCGPCANGAFNFPAMVKKWKLTENIRTGRDNWGANTINYDIQGSKHFKSVIVGFGAPAGDKIKVQRFNGTWFEAEHLGYVAASIQKLEAEAEKEGI